MPETIETDVVIVGAGPVGLFAVFELGLQGLKCHLIDALERPGGQCIELYPDKPIYDIPGTAEISGEALTENLLKQISPFDPQFHFAELAVGLTRLEDGLFEIETDQGNRFVAKVAVLAIGGGYFRPKRPAIPEIGLYEGKSVLYSTRRAEAFQAQDVLVVGSDDAAIECAVKLTGSVKSVTLVHRRPEIRAASHNVETLRDMQQRNELELVQGQVVSLQGTDGWLAGASIKTPGGEKLVQATRMLPFLGLTVSFGPIANWGLDVEENQIPVDTEKFETSVPGIFAIGDISAYPGKLKLILSGFHEATLMARSAGKLVNPGRRPVLQYTTSSASLRSKLAAA